MTNLALRLNKQTHIHVCITFEPHLSINFLYIMFLDHSRIYIFLFELIKIYLLLGLAVASNGLVHSGMKVGRLVARFTPALDIFLLWISPKISDIRVIEYNLSISFIQ